MKEYENNIYNQGYKNIAGLDEAGRGAWAGPIVVAICILEKNYFNPLIKDSKTINEKNRNIIFQQIKKDAILIDWIAYDAKFVDQYNPKHTSIKGMEFLIKKHKKIIDFCLIDAEKIETESPHLSIIKGDSKSQTIAAASIIAKVIRDKIMIDLGKQYPEYNFCQNKGYGTNQHLKSIQKNGPIFNIHRYSYKPIKQILNKAN